jgi:hypothetical protein
MFKSQHRNLNMKNEASVSLSKPHKNSTTVSKYNKLAETSE